MVDLLDRALDKGLVINADIVICVAGIPLIGVNLRAALAGMETMLQYGFMREWDEQIRASERDRREKPVSKKAALSPVSDEKTGHLAISGPTSDEPELEMCPQCGAKVADDEPLEMGCRSCGWVSVLAEEAR